MCYGNGQFQYSVRDVQLTGKLMVRYVPQVLVEHIRICLYPYNGMSAQHLNVMYIIVSTYR